VSDPTTQRQTPGDGPSTPAPPGEPARFGPWRREVCSFLELLALTGIALTQPALDILRRNPAIFITRDTSGTQLIVLTIGLVLVAPLLLWGLEVLVGLVFPQLRRPTHLVLLGGVLTVIGVEVLKKQTELGSTWLVVGALVIGVAGALLVMRFDVLQLWLRFLAVAPFVFAVLFLVSAPVAKVVFDPSPAAATDVDVKNPERVVMVVLDEFPTQSLLDGNGNIDATLFPNFARLAGDSTWYRNSTTVAPETEQAVPAIVTGQLPQSAHEVPVATSYPDNLFTLLGDTYEMNVHERITRLCPESLCPESTRDVARAQGGLRKLVRETLDLWADDASPKRQPEELNLGKIADPNLRALGTGRDFVASLQPSDRPKLDFLHVLLPHQAWHYVGSGQDYLQTGVAPGLAFYAWSTPWSALSGKQRHLLQLQATDRMLGEILDRLEEIGVYDDSLFVLTADHGVAFRAEESFRGVSEDNYPDIMWTPLFVKEPRQAGGRVDDRPVKSVDLVPTIADILEAPIPWDVDGHSTLGPRQPDDPEIFEWDLNPLKPPPGEKYAPVDGKKGLAEVERHQAWPPAADPRLRLYRIGEYGDLVGRPAAPLVAAGDAPSAALDQPQLYRRVVRTARTAPWLYVSGHVATPERGRPLAIAVNGVVAGLSETALDPGVANRTQFWGMLAPDAFVDGDNTVELYAIEGPADAPRLVPVRRTR
jgi:hypothetical protein